MRHESTAACIIRIRPCKGTSWEDWWCSRCSRITSSHKPSELKDCGWLPLPPADENALLHDDGGVTPLHLDGAVAAGIVRAYIGMVRVCAGLPVAVVVHLQLTGAARRGVACCMKKRAGRDAPATTGRATPAN